MKTPKQINIDIKEVDATLERVKNDSLQNGDYEMIKSMFETVIYLNRALDNKTTSIKRLLKMLFGAKTEKSKNKPDQSDKKDPKPSQETSENSDKPDSDNNPDIKPGDASENKPEDTETDG